ncbi:NAD(P)/FAD-dependent oxidoreductase [Aquisalinus flavus]|uniref:Aminoacetone oxidase family FAD-binding enzyme n=1 Tax=Aquisalinus flavus TaxID=1526572 RepID=A0A8J2V413_9PROT|nr:NAD(P)/FAD-dependent oxidoreductase [Aquisalinus flavus]MBD0427137.1 NAD(P)/FAD-dependent oxidoreductase [Aquisalinus flavus]UNE46957.1 NAD(P)/FAD-dependent oxidoreductase [Aquisalinus flavus]GGC98648.1 hypothetical protein GCM10011342_04500 [Aquisalinus flavus]
MTSHFSTIIIGAGAAGMMCAAHAGGDTLVIDHARAPGEKIRISGGGRCNFTNIHAGPDNFISGNPHFAKSALKRYTQWDFIGLVASHGIAWHEKTLGQLFCDDSSKQIVSLLITEMERAGARLALRTAVDSIEKTESGFRLTLSGDRQGEVTCRNLVIATGGLSIPKMGATRFGYDVARQFGIAVTPTRAGLVPFTFDETAMQDFKPMAGVACDARVTTDRTAFEEAMLFTHRGLSGPAVLQASSYWRDGETIRVTLMPGTDFLGKLRAIRMSNGRRDIAAVIADILPRRLGQYMAGLAGVSGNIADYSDRKLQAIADLLSAWTLKPAGTEGYRTAEVTVGGVSTEALSSQTMMARDVPGLYFIGEVVDVTGWLGGYNFQWAWSSGWAAGTAIAAAKES